MSREGRGLIDNAQPTCNCYRIGTGPESIRNSASEVGLRVRMTMLAAVGLSLLLSMTVAPASGPGCDTGASCAARPAAAASAIPTTPCSGTPATTFSTTPSTSTSTSPAGRSPPATPRSRPSPCSTCAHSTSISLDWRSMRSRSTANRHRLPAIVASSPSTPRRRCRPERASRRRSPTTARPIGQDAPTVGTLLGDILGAILGGAEQKPGPEEGEQYGSGWWTGREEIFIAGEPAGAESWFPVNGHPADKATYTLRLTVPEPYSVVANGILTETIPTETGTTTVWESRNPMASYLVTLHAGRLDDRRPRGATRTADSHRLRRVRPAGTAGHVRPPAGDDRLFRDRSSAPIPSSRPAARSSGRRSSSRSKRRHCRSLARSRWWATRH